MCFRQLQRFTVAVAFSAPLYGQTSLDMYVARPDASFDFAVVDASVGNGYVIFDLAITSQMWRSPSQVANRNEWEHVMRIVVPDSIQHDTALLHIRGLNNDQRAAFVDTETAVTTGTIVVELTQVPNQPLEVANGQGSFDPLVEDALLARTFRHFLDGGDDEWPALLPMVKSAVRAMDATQQFMAEQDVVISDFVVTGASKRGWATWLTAATDDRVVAIVPRVTDVLNMDEQMAYQRRAYLGVTDNTCGGYACATADYVLEGVMDELDTQRGQELLQIVDPFEYRDRLEIPKYIINAVGDEFFLPDSTQFYYDELVGSKYLRYIPNANHSTQGLIAETAIRDFYGAVLADIELPEYSWDVESGGKTIRVQTESSPTRVNLWQASTAGARDFRLDGFGEEPQWETSPLVADENGDFVATVAEPTDLGATAFMVELEFDVNGREFFVTTEVSVVSAALLCDFNRDLVCDPNDLTSETLFAVDLSTGSSTQEFITAYDINEDMLVDHDDLKFWLAAAAEMNGFGSAYLLGDSNLDGRVDFEDFLALSVGFNGSDRSWVKGNFDGDPDVDFVDFLALAERFGSTLAPSELNYVPEASCRFMTLVLLWALSLFRTRQRDTTNIGDCDAQSH